MAMRIANNIPAMTTQRFWVLIILSAGNVSEILQLIGIKGIL